MQIPDTTLPIIESMIATCNYETQKNVGDIDAIYGWLVALDGNMKYDANIHVDLITCSEMEEMWAPASSLN